MDRLLNRVWNSVRRTGGPRAVGVVYVPDRIATAAERRYFDSLVSREGLRHDPNVVLAAG
ncbi:hypothetical protein CLV49_0062 [Labedella gwakjiensis]|uniref:Uncharacterized protein n=1 Tax=Labedella gwakjiensis TaxID=390269 RepID=A0A2P8GR80_9MICO|nr:hypothetical protein [Labedella gwakjiensis]PSL36471.1 hypothetical protein CLV49_0062 [Labedella gwakjiensis]RUQ85606.1 hypothetical protein ELQ93_00750 [Labedella gwakjiensis]